jgi:hypothetical protein
MVNTFVTFRKKLVIGDRVRYYPDYDRTAKTLDLIRLKKQCLEAWQILNILTRIRQIAEWEGWEPCPDTISTRDIPAYVLNYTARVEWLKSTRQRYLKLKYRYAIQNNTLKKISVDSLPIQLRKYDKYIVKKQYVVFKSKVYPIDRVAFPTDVIYTLGFSQHAAPKMWIGHEDSLRHYINTCMKHYTSRSGFVLDIPTYNVPYFYKCHHPWWITHYRDIILTHRASLMRKKPEYYQPIFFSITPKKFINHGYIWPGSFTTPSVTIQKIMTDPTFSDINLCYPVN